MKRILLTTTSLVLAAGVAQADITWSGSATAGLARDGKVKAVAAKAGTTGAAYIAANMAVAGDAQDERDEQADLLDAIGDEFGTFTITADSSGVETAAEIQTGLTEVRALIAATLKAADVVASDLAPALEKVSRASGGTYHTAAKKAAEATAALDSAFGTATAAVPTGKMKQYSEVNATASASVATDMGWVVSAAISVDAGTGYDFADDDTFDSPKANGVGLDSVSIDFGAGGKLKLAQNDVAHLVDADDDAAADLLYTNTFGTASFSLAADIDDGDSDVKATSGSVAWDNTVDALSAETAYTVTAATAADVQWSTKVSMPLAGTNVYFAADEAGGDAYGVSGTYAGIGWSVDSKREALAKDTGAKRSNTVKVSYATGALTLGASYDSIKDGDQWGVSAAYAAGALSLNVSTDEGDDWSASGAYDLGNGASLVGGTNYTEDAYVGVSFAF